jgi:endonuclease/exonuclease/phosphatase family metal-dependent hydrolase
VRIATFNTQHCAIHPTERIDIAHFAEYIKAMGADVIGLNEIRGVGVHPEYTAQTEKLAALTGMPYYRFAPAIELPEGFYGNAFLSKIPIVSAEVVPIPDPEVRTFNGYYESRCVLKVKLENGLTVLVTHMGLNPDEQENAVKTVLSLAENEKCVLMGDFNMTPDDATLAPIFKKMKDTAALIDGEGLSFPSDKPDRKIDYIFVSRDVEVVSAEIPPVVASDHRPHTATVKL